MAKSTWSVDHSHSEVGFKVKHLMITNVSGSIKSYDVHVETEGDNFMTAAISFTADVASLTTGNEQRDAHLRSDDFFNAEAYPQIKFVATGYENVDNDGSYELYGDLTIRDVTQNVKLDVEFGGIVRDPWGQTKAGFTINGKISREAFGLKWNALMEAGGAVVADDIRVSCTIELTKQG